MSNKDPKNVTVTGRYVGGALFEPKISANAPEGSRPKFSAIIVLDEGQDALIDEAVNYSMDETFGDKVPKKHSMYGVQEGDDEEYESTFEKKFINPKSIHAPKTVLKRDGMIEKVDDDDDVFYAGCYVAINVSAYSMPGPKNPCTTLSLNSILFRKDGERISSQVAPKDAFADMADSAVSEEDYAF